METMDMLLREIPHVDKLMHSNLILESSLPRALVADHVRKTLAALRNGILSGAVCRVPEAEELCDMALNAAKEEYGTGIRPVINGTGVILHSNLGRACLSEKAALAAMRVAREFSSLEYDLKTGRRGERMAVIEAQLKRLTGAEAALVVNNNAAAVLLVLTALAKGGSVIVSRGELVEIGGSFRLPDIMEQCGCVLREVGTTNKTRLNDYEKAINEDVRVLLKVHTSNFKITGFTESTSVKELAGLAQKYDLPIVEDIGSCALLDLGKYGIYEELNIFDDLRDGADIICFSGDKLLGGPQCGIVVGRSHYISLMRKHPLYRALRVDKMTVAALEETLRIYMEQGRAESEIPVISMIAQTPEIIRNKANRLCGLLRDCSINAEVIPTKSTVGGGSAPGQELASFAISISPEMNGNPSEFARAMLSQDKPIIGRIEKDAYLIDMRTVYEDDLEYIAEAADAVRKEIR